MGQGGRRRGGQKPQITEQDRRADRPQWRMLAERALRAAELGAADVELGRLGSQANGLRWPASLPEGALVCALAGEAYAYSRQTNPHVRAALAPNLKRIAEIVLELLDAIERSAPAAAANEPAAPSWRSRADIGDGDDA